MTKKKSSFASLHKNAINFLSAWYRKCEADIEKSRPGIGCRLYQQKNRESLPNLVAQGCDKELIIAAAVVLAKQPSFWRRDLISSVQKRLPALKECADALEFLFNNQNAKPDRFFDFETVEFLRHVPKAIRDYEDQLSRRYRDISFLNSKHFVRNDTLIMLGDHIKSKTGQHHWEKVADLISEFTEEKDLTPTDTSLQKAYRRAK
jgi:hypothetical protein